MSTKVGIIIVPLCVLVFVSANYWEDRAAFIKKEEGEMLGSSIILNDKENIVNNILMRYKSREYDSGFVNPGIFAPGRHFFDARRDIEKSKVFKFIKTIPKGAALHGHDLALASFDYLYNLTYRDDLYACVINKRLKFKFLLNPNSDDKCQWQLVKELRRQNLEYDEWIRSNLTLDVKDPRTKYPDIDTVWQVFKGIFGTIYDMITYRPVFQDFFYQALKELYEDNVMYLEFRTTLPKLYELNGTVYDQLQTAQFYKETLGTFKENYPNFLGAQLIYAPSRVSSNETANNYVSIVKSLKNSYPNFLAGFDLVGQEDKGYPLTSYISQLQEMSSNGIDFFFHAGETNWFESSTDFNLVDAILLGTKRIGHGYALAKHPLAMKKVKEEHIAIEVCPISNQVLMLVDDMRNHPAASLIAEGYPVVVSNDDPGFWSTVGLSYDFYMMFMGIAGRNADIRLIKQLAENSILYSALSKNEIVAAMKLWEKQWDQFLDNTIDKYYK